LDRGAIVSDSKITKKSGKMRLRNPRKGKLPVTGVKEGHILPCSWPFACQGLGMSAQKYHADSSFRHSRPTPAAKTNVLESRQA
jgi:hypothetical protein